MYFYGPFSIAILTSPEAPTADLGQARPSPGASWARVPIHGADRDHRPGRWTRADPGRDSREIPLIPLISRVKLWNTWGILNISGNISGKNYAFFVKISWEHVWTPELFIFFQKSNLSVTHWSAEAPTWPQHSGRNQRGLEVCLLKCSRTVAKCVSERCRTLQKASDGSHNVSHEMLNFGKYRSFNCFFPGDATLDKQDRQSRKSCNEDTCIRLNPDLVRLGSINHDDLLITEYWKYACVFQSGTQALHFCSCHFTYVYVFQIQWIWIYHWFMYIHWFTVEICQFDRKNDGKAWTAGSTWMKKSLKPPIPLESKWTRPKWSKICFGTKSRWPKMIHIPWRIHGAAIYGITMDPINIYPSHVSI